MSEKEIDMKIERIDESGLPGFFTAFSPRGVVDAGCGDGLYLQNVLRAFPAYEKAFGIDPSESAIETAAERFRGEARVSFIRASAERMPLGDGIADLVLMSHSLHHMERPAAALSETRRVLSTEGSLAITDFVDEGLGDLERLREEFHAIRGEIDVAKGGYMRAIYRIEEIETLLRDSGFRRERAVLVVHPVEPGKDAAPRLLEAVRKDASGIADERVRDGILRRAEAVVARIASASHARPPSYLAEWRTEP